MTSNAEKPNVAKQESPPLEHEVLPVPSARGSRELPKALASVRGVSPPPSRCGMRSVSVKPARACGAQALERLASAVELDAAKRDTALSELEGCTEFPAGMVRALRADSMRECADSLVAPYLARAQGKVDAELGDALLALALAARFDRAVRAPQRFTGAGTERDVAKYRADVLAPWKERELAKLSDLDAAAAVVGTSGYAATIVTLARERALRTLYRLGRGAPIPDQIKKDYELRTRYYGMVDATLADVSERRNVLEAQASEQVSRQGLHRSPDTDARYPSGYPNPGWGARDDGYFGFLLLEPPPGTDASTTTERIVRKIPSFYAELLFGDGVVNDARLLGALVESGLSPRQRYSLSQRTLSEAEVELLAYFHATLAQRTRAARHWDEAVLLLEPLTHRSPRAELVLATARAARTGPRDVRESKLEPRRAFDVSALEAFASGSLPVRYRAFALNNAARLLVQRSETVQRGYLLLENARGLPSDEATRRCVRPFEGSGFIVENAVRAAQTPCDLPALP